MTGLDPEFALENEAPRRPMKPEAAAPKQFIDGLFRDGKDNCADCNNSGQMWIGSEKVECPTCGGASAASRFLRRRLRTEAEARGDQAMTRWGASPTGYRIEPTAEDVWIFTRMSRRLMNWSLKENIWRRMNDRAPITGGEFVGITRRATLDLLEFGPAPAGRRASSVSA